MMRIVGTILKTVLALAVCVGLGWYYLSRVPYPDAYTYGVSFNTPYARELGLNWEEVYTAVLRDLGVRHVRLAAHWPMVEPADDAWNFTELDRQMDLAETYGADVVLSVGRRLPRWPECHVPEWADELTWATQQDEIREYMRAVIARYKDHPALLYWQVENEPFLTVFAYEHCGLLDKDFLDEEIVLVKHLDPTHPVLVTDSGNLGVWYGAYRRGDLFGTSVYVHLYNPQTGPFKSLLPPDVYVAKRKFMELVYGTKETLLIELSLEPWLEESVTTAPLETQFERMPVTRLDEILSYAHETKLSRQYLWGVEWWYWLKVRHAHPEYWERARSIFTP